MDGARLKGRDHWVIALLYGFLYASLLIIITEIIWDGVFKFTGITGLKKEIIESFFRAALLEEFFKFTGFRMADNKYRFSCKKDSMLAAGTIGLVYAVVEKAASGNLMAIILGILFPMHILWQLNQGRHYYDYKQAKAAGEQQTKRRELFLAVPLIILIHGSWDAVISIIGYLFEESGWKSAELAGGLLTVVLVIFGVTYMVITIKRTLAVTRAAKAAEQQKKDEIS